MVDAMRKQLDALMGTNRNGSGPSIKKHFTDPDVCISYLLGLCPHEMFNNTKMDMGDCPKLHSAILKGEYEEARKKKDYGFDYHVEMQLQRYVEDCDRKIKRNIKHLEDIQAPDPEDKAIIQQVQEFMDLAEKLGEEGKVEESLEYIQKAEALKAKKSDMTAAAASIIAMIPSVPDGGPTASQHQKLRVCDICAAYLSLYDSDKRLSDHFGGKLHIGYLTLRERYKELKDARLKQREDRLQYINQSSDRTSYHDRNSYQVGDIDDSFERDLERIRQRQREQQRRDQEDDLPDRDKDRERVTNRDRDDYDESRNGRRPSAPYRRERIDYDRPPQDDHDSRYDRQDYDRPRGREYRDYDRPTYNRPEKRYRDYDQPNVEPEYEQDYNDDRDYNRNNRDYDRNYDNRDRDYNDRDYDRDRKGYDRDYDRNYDRDREYDKGRDYDDRERDYKDRDSDGEDRERERGYDNRPRNDDDYRGRDYERSYDRGRDRDYDRDYDRPK